MKDNVLDVRTTVIDHDLVVTSNLRDEDAEKMEQAIFENGFLPYEGTDQNGNVLHGNLVDLKKIKGKYYFYIKIK